MSSGFLFKNRENAGYRLALKLQKYYKHNALVLGLPRGGVVVAARIAQALEIPLDIWGVRKIHSPFSEEYAIGAIDENGTEVWNEEECRAAGLEWIEQQKVIQYKELERRVQAYRGARPKPDLKDKIVILVDDGIATGFTMRAAIQGVRKESPRAIVVAVPALPADMVEELQKETDELYYLYTPTFFLSIGIFYEEFPQVTDEEVKQLSNKGSRQPS